MTSFEPSKRSSWSQRTPKTWKYYWFVHNRREFDSLPSQSLSTTSNELIQAWNSGPSSELTSIGFFGDISKQTTSWLLTNFHATVYSSNFFMKGARKGVQIKCHLCEWESGRWMEVRVGISLAFLARFPGISRGFWKLGVKSSDLKHLRYEWTLVRIYKTTER